jgi:hypothetical protein
MLSRTEHATEESILMVNLSYRACGLGVAALLLGLAFAPASRADDTMPQSVTPVPQQSASNPQAAEPMIPPTIAPRDVPNFNPNAVPAISVYRNGAGEVIDPRTGVPAVGYGSNDGGF